MTTLPSLAPALLETDADGLTPEQQTAISVHLAFDAGRVWCHACERLTVAGLHCGECGKRHADARPRPDPKKCRAPNCETYVSTRFCPSCGLEAQGEIERRIAEGEDRTAVIAEVASRAQDGVKASLAQLDAFLKKHGKSAGGAAQGAGR